MLPGYTFTEEHGIDSRGGRLAKTGGPNIGFEIGAQRASIANNVRPQEILWSKTADIRGTTARIYMTRGAFLLVDNGYANFVARNVRTPEDVADVLVTALSYDPDQSRRTPAVKK